MFFSKQQRTYYPSVASLQADAGDHDIPVWCNETQTWYRYTENVATAPDNLSVIRSRGGSSSWLAIGGQYTADGLDDIEHSLATEANDFLVSSKAGQFVKKTLAQTMTILGLSGSNSGDETATTIKSKLGISTLTGSNTGDQNDFTLTPSASVPLTFTEGAVAPNFAAGNHFTLTLDGTNTLSNPSGATVNQRGSIVIRQASTGDKTLAMDTHYLFSDLGVPPSVTAKNDAIDVIYFHVLSSTEIACQWLPCVGMTPPVS